LKSNSTRALAFVLCLLSLVGCDKGTDEVAVKRTVVVTNEVVVTRTVTNVVTATNVVTVTNVIEKAPERILSARKTAPYVVSSATLDEARFRRFLSDAGVRVIDCSAGSVALVEASDKSVRALGTVTAVKALSPEDKITADAGERVSVTPLSSIDVAAVVKAVRDLGGEVEQVTTIGQPRVRAKMSYSAIRKLAVRGDVRRIERDKK